MRRRTVVLNSMETNIMGINIMVINIMKLEIFWSGHCPEPDSIVSARGRLKAGLRALEATKRSIVIQIRY